jgi:hypothetical protein
MRTRKATAAQTGASSTTCTMRGGDEAERGTREVGAEHRDVDSDSQQTRHDRVDQGRGPDQSAASGGEHDEDGGDEGSQQHQGECRPQSSSPTSTPPRRGWPNDDDTAIVIRMNEAGTIAPMRETNRRGPRVAAATSARTGRLADPDCGCSSAPRTAAVFVTGFAPSLTVFLSQSSVDVRGLTRLTFGALASSQHGPSHGL